MPRKPHRIEVPLEALKFFSECGKKGGKAKGASKVRGDADYYRRIRPDNKKKGDYPLTTRNP